jgi:hypothetical protein
VCANALGEVRAAIGTEVYAIVDKVRSELGLPVAVDACGTLSNRVVVAMPEEECSFFWTHSTRPPAVQMNNVVALERERVGRGNRLRAPPTLRLSVLFHEGSCYRPHGLQRGRHLARSRPADHYENLMGAERQKTEARCHPADISSADDSGVEPD